MKKEDMKSRLSVLTDETDDRILSTFLDIAAEKILAKCYPFRPDERDVPSRYHGTQLEIAAYLLNKRGAEGETSHSENGVNRSYESASVPDSMLKNVVPFVSTFSCGG